MEQKTFQAKEPSFKSYANCFQRSSDGLNFAKAGCYIAREEWIEDWLVKTLCDSAAPPWSMARYLKLKSCANFPRFSSLVPLQL